MRARAQTAGQHGGRSGNLERGGTGSLDGDLSATCPTNSWPRLVASQDPQPAARRILVRQNTHPIRLYRGVRPVEVWSKDRSAPLNEIGVGEPIGETGFFSGATRNRHHRGGPRLRRARARRPSFDRVAREVPAIYQTPAGRAWRAGWPTPEAAPPARSAWAWAHDRGDRRGRPPPIPPAFFDALPPSWRTPQRSAADRDQVRSRFPGQALDDPTVLNWLNAIENEYDLIGLPRRRHADRVDAQAIRQADQVLIVWPARRPSGLNPVETFAFAIHPSLRRRLVRVHERRTGAVEGTGGLAARTRRDPCIITLRWRTISTSRACIAS